MKLLVTGAGGQLGWALQRRLGSGNAEATPGFNRPGASAPAHDLVALDRTGLDLSDPAAVERAIERAAPAVVINAAAYTAVDRAEREPDLARRVNAEAPAAMARACRRVGAALVHFSTDYVFDGARPGRYAEDDPTGPLNVYGRTKLAGEQAVLASDCAAIVLRTTWVYGEHGDNFARTMLRLATERTQLRVVADQRGAPTSAARLAGVVRELIGQAVASTGAGAAATADTAALLDWFAGHRGLYHAAAAGETTWFDYARTVIATAAESGPMRARLKLSAGDVEPIPSSAYPTPAARPANSLLDCSKLARTFGLEMPDWRGDVVDYVRRLCDAR